MKTQYTVALSLLMGVAIGVVAVQGLHAQVKPPAYVVVAIRSITDPDGMKTLMEKASPGALAAAGGHYVIRTNDVIGLDGAPPKRFVLIGFDNIEKARAWQDSPATKEITALRTKSTDSISFMVEGVAN
ncbi:MAG TPA: DUF1330 domain-containing protein [Roseiarcus sp.]|nr:DUF1330 domain-containing protein [Roseiarcus sp.]